MLIRRMNVLIVIGLLLIASKASRADDGRPVNIEKLSAASPTPDDFQLIYAGDIMLADTPGKVIARGIDPFLEFAAVLRGADVTIGNLECVVALSGEAVEKPWVFRAQPEVLPLLKRHFGIVSLANNHTGDFGHSAFLEQLQLLDKHKIAHFGGGRDCAQARMPHLLTVRGRRLALLGYNEFQPRSFEAGPDWPGVAWSVDEQVVADIEAARKRHQADLVIPYMHWGWEMQPANDRQKQLARLMIDAGADAVIGGHPHVTQEVEYYKGKLIVYSLGNFIFDGFDEGPGRTGWLVRLRMNKEGLVAWDTVVAHMDEQGIPHLERNAKSPSGIAGSSKIEECQALIDSPLASLEKKLGAAELP
jgi:poly-gamma-glutamate synthesis protein (capsule biosynthesis protein)